MAMRSAVRLLPGLAASPATLRSSESTAFFLLFFLSLSSCSESLESEEDELLLLLPLCEELVELGGRERREVGE